MSLIELVTRAARHTGRSTSLTARLSLWRSRRALATLDADALRDIGVSAQAARKEAALPIWDVPETWKGR